MSAVAGIFHTDGSPIDEALLRKMRDVVDYRGPDGAGIWADGNVGLAHRLLWETEESVRERQPLSNGQGLWVTADCRIDNREELRSEFQSLGVWAAPLDSPDVLYILLAYQVWGEDAPVHLLGDFSFAIWDAPRRMLFCCRDPLGVKPFVYYWDGRALFFGSEMKQLFQNSAIDRQINSAYLGSFLIMVYPNREETPYKVVRRLAPGHFLILRVGGGFRIDRYWNWDPDAESLSTASLPENAEKFKDLFRQSVRNRLRVPGGFRAGSLLSGGLDSSSIVSIAASEPGFQPDSLPVFTMCYPETDPSCRLPRYDSVDEDIYSSALVEQYGLESHRIEMRGFGPFQGLEETLWYEENPLFFPNFAYFQYTLGLIGKAQVRCLLHGEGGDELFGVGSRRRSLRALIPDRWKVPYRRLFHKRVPDWIEKKFAEEAGLYERADRDFQYCAQHHRSASYGLRIWIHAGFIPLYLEAMDRLASRHQLEMRLPCLDLRLFRFMASVPPAQKANGGVEKILLRESMKGLWPSRIRARLRKAEFTPVIRTVLEKYAAADILEVFKNPHPFLKRAVNIKRVDRIRIEVELSGSRPLQSLWFLWYLVSIDQWLKKGGCNGKQEAADFTRQACCRGKAEVQHPSLD